MTIRILHLSDLHFGNWPFKEIKAGSGGGDEIVEVPRSTHAFVDVDGKSDPAWLIDRLGCDGRLRTRAPDAIVVSGDIGWSGAATDYQLAEKFFEGLTRLWPSATLVITPGNHDLSWDASRKGENAQAAFRDTVRSLAKERVSEWLFADPAAHEDRNSLASIHRVQDAIFVTANSACSLSHDSKTSAVCVHPKTLIELESRLAEHPREALRVFVIHHHLLPFYDDHEGAQFEPGRAVGADRTILANSAQVQEWLARNGFDLVLHGHKHTPHARRDVLVSGPNADERDIVIVGAGSAGVFRKELPPGEHHSYNIVTVSHGARRTWRMQVDVRNINRGIVPPSAGFTFDREIGVQPPSLPHVFSARDWISCHAALAQQFWPDGIGDSDPGVTRTLTNFISVVEQAPAVSDEEFEVPATSRNGSSKPSASEFLRAFYTLYPEYLATNGWRDRTRLSQVLQSRSSRFHFRHGSRLFAPDRALGIDGAPFFRAVSQIGPGSTRAYASTFRADADVRGSRSEPMPALQGVQFLVEDNRFLDVVATFRNLELSYWWPLNIIEVSRLLHFAAEQAGPTYIPRRITFVSPVADWRWRPAAPTISKLDEASLEELTACVHRTCSGGGEPAAELVAMLQQKAAMTNEFSLGEARVSDLADLLLALDPLRASPKSAEVVKYLREAAGALSEAVARAEERKNLASVASQKLKKAAAALLSRLESSPP
jgi:DNA repair exonuclease SbcCD nuclease subunit